MIGIFGEGINEVWINFKWYMNRISSYSFRGKLFGIFYNFQKNYRKFKQLPQYFNFLLNKLNLLRKLYEKIRYVKLGSFDSKNSRKKCDDEKLFSQFYTIKWKSFSEDLTAVFFKLVQCQSQLDCKIQPFGVEGVRSTHT